MSISTTDHSHEFGEVIKPDVFTKPILDTQGVRRAGSSVHSMGGSMLEPRTNRYLNFDSNLERRWILQLFQRHDVVLVQEQSVRTPYVDRRGKDRTTVWDLLVTLQNGEKELVSVKRLEVAERPSFQDGYRRMIEGIPPGTANRVWLATEYNLKTHLVDRGELYMTALSMQRPDKADSALEFASANRGTTKVLDICRHLDALAPKLEPAQHFARLSDHFWTVVWLLAERLLRPANDDYLTMRSEVAVS